MSSRRLSNDLPPNIIDDTDANSQTSQTSDTSDQDLQHLDSTSQSTIDPLLSAIDDLEGRIITSLDNFKLHPGTLSNAAQYDTIHSELNSILRPVLEIAAHGGPSTARNHWRSGYRANTVDVAIEEVYKRLNSDLILPVVLESAQSDVIPAKRAASLGFFHALYNEYKTPGSYLDYHESSSTSMMLTGQKSGSGYSGSLYGTIDKNSIPPSRGVLRQRTSSRNEKSVELLRYWVEASSSCTVPGSFSDVQSDGAIASRAVISACAVVRPALKHVADKIASADDAGALKLFIPVMRMIGGVLRRLFSPSTLSNEKGGSSKKGGGRNNEDALKSACIKFLETVILCFSSKVQPKMSRTKTKPGTQTLSSSTMDDFALDDLPMGHHIITRQALEEIGEDAFTILRGLAIMGGQVKVDSGVVRDVMLSLGLDANGMYIGLVLFLMLFVFLGFTF